MAKRQGCDEFGLNFQIEKSDSVEIQKNFYVVILIKTAVNGFVFDDFFSSCDNDLPFYRRFKLRSASGELGLRHHSVVILVEFYNLHRVLDRQRQCCLQAVRALSYR